MPFVNSDYSAFGCPQINMDGVDGVTQSVTVREFADPVEVRNAPPPNPQNPQPIQFTKYLEVTVVTLVSGDADELLGPDIGDVDVDLSSVVTGIGVLIERSMIRVNDEYATVTHRFLIYPE
jgi:hypothetical protein